MCQSTRTPQLNQKNKQDLTHPRIDYNCVFGTELGTLLVYGKGSSRPDPDETQTKKVKIVCKKEKKTRGSPPRSWPDGCMTDSGFHGTIVMVLICFYWYILTKQKTEKGREYKEISRVSDVLIGKEKKRKRDASKVREANKWPLTQYRPNPPGTKSCAFLPAVAAPETGCSPVAEFRPVPVSICLEQLETKKGHTCCSISRTLNSCELSLV